MSIKDKHYWLSTASDKNGVPLEYKCVICGKILILESRDKKVRDYLREKYAAQTA